MSIGKNGEKDPEQACSGESPGSYETEGFTAADRA
jgi:hypothetical protein